MSDFVRWTENGLPCQAVWRSESKSKAPKRVVLADDTMTADQAYRLACEGTALLWRGDFHNARQLLQAMKKRASRKPMKAASSLVEVFHFHRQAQAQRARVLSMLLISSDANYVIPLRRAPDVSAACFAAYGAPAPEPFVFALRELQGIIGAYEWRKAGVWVEALGANIYPHYGVYSPVRGEYLTLIARAPLPDACASLSLAFDIGTGTGVLAALLVRRGLQQVVATDQDPRALACALENLELLDMTSQVHLSQTNLFPDGRAPLVVCNPPWVPARPNAPIEYAIYDFESGMLRGFLAGLAAHLTEHGEGWLILSDFAEHLGLRSRSELLAWIDAAGLVVLGRDDIRPQHPKTRAVDDPLHTARAAEVTSLWRLGVKK